MSRLDQRPTETDEEIDGTVRPAISSLSQIENAAIVVEEWREQVRIVLERCFELNHDDALSREQAFFQSIEDAETGNQAPNIKLAILHASPFQIAASLVAPFDISTAAARYSELAAASDLPDGRIPPPSRGRTVRQAA